MIIKYIVLQNNACTLNNICLYIVFYSLNQKQLQRSLISPHAFHRSSTTALLLINLFLIYLPSVFYFRTQIFCHLHKILALTSDIYRYMYVYAVISLKKFNFYNYLYVYVSIFLFNGKFL